MLGRSIALALGVSKTVDLTKETIYRITGLEPMPYLKSVYAMGLSIAAAHAAGRNREERLLIACAVSGLSAIVHEAYAALSTTSDRNKVVVIQRGQQAAVDQLPGRGPRIPNL